MSMGMANMGGGRHLKTGLKKNVFFRKIISIIRIKLERQENIYYNIFGDF